MDNKDALTEAVMDMARRLSDAGVNMRSEIEHGPYSPEYEKATRRWGRRYRALRRLVTALTNA